MDKRVMQAALVHEVRRWSALSYERLRSEVQDRLVEEGEIDGVPYAVEVQLLEDLPDYVHVCVAVSDESMRWFTRPLSHDSSCTVMGAWTCRPTPARTQLLLVATAP